MKYKLLAIDIDGTLLDSTGRVPEAHRAAIGRARDAGMIVALCTGRGLAESRPAIEALDHHGPIVLAGGSLVSDPTTNKTLHRAIIEPDLAEQVARHLLGYDEAVLMLVDPEVSDEDYVVINAEKLTANTQWWFDMIGAVVRRVDSLDAYDLHHVLRTGIVGPASRMPPIEQSLTDALAPRVFVQHFTAVKEEGQEPVHVLEVFASGVNKWSGLRWLADEHGIAPQQVAAIGDHINDVAMLAEAGCGIAMGNAVEAARQAADYITETNNDHGLAHAIDRLISERWR